MNLTTRIELSERAAMRVATLVAVACGLVATAYALRYADQLPLDLYSFRQTQTALTAYWLRVDGFRLAYDTPVLGAPWSIPFEFPLYQWLVALLSRWTGVALDPVGRLVSFAFLVACLVPAHTIVRLLRLAGRRRGTRTITLLGPTWFRRGSGSSAGHAEHQ